MHRHRLATVALGMVALVATSAACGLRSDHDRGATPPNPAATVPPGSLPPATPTASVKPAVDATGQVREATLTTADGRERSYRLYIPTSVHAGDRAPLLLGLHGGTGWGAQFAQSSELDRLAEANGVIAVYPDGIGGGPTEGGDSTGFALRTWNGGVCCGAAARKDVDDVAFLSSLIDELVRELPIDPRRVFVTGHSNGAIMAYRLACEAPERIAAIAVFAGTLGVTECRSATGVSLMHLHGTADANLPIGGGVGPKGISGVAFPPPLDGVRQFATAMRCEGDGTRFRSPTNTDVETTLWATCASGAEVQWVTIDGASHAWPGSAPNARTEHTVGAPYADYDASAELLAFLLAHPRPA